MLDVVVFLVSLGVRVIRAMCRRRADLVLENVALRQQVTALKKERPRPLLEDTERAFWVPFELSRGFRGIPRSSEAFLDLEHRFHPSETTLQARILSC